MPKKEPGNEVRVFTFQARLLPRHVITPNPGPLQITVDREFFTVMEMGVVRGPSLETAAIRSFFSRQKKKEFSSYVYDAY